MTIDKAALFENTKALWPATISIADPNATYKIYRANEESHSVDDDWQQVAMWAYHQAVSQLEKRAAVEGLLAIQPHEIDFAEFDKWMRSNLWGDDCWLAERAEWESTT